DVLAQVLAANVQSLLDRDRVRRAENAAGLRARLIEAVLHADDPVPVLHAMSPQLADAFDAPVVIVAQQARLHVHGALDRDAATAVLQWLKDIEPAGNALVDVSAVDDWPADLAARMAPWCGLLALRFDELAEGWLVMLRKEQIETVLWGGQPEKVYANGPLGPRLTPRGSFDVWKETVRGTSVPWSPEEIEQAAQLRDELVRAGAARLAEMNRARSHLLAMLGHDLRDPLQSIRMAAKVLELGSGDGDSRLSQRIESSSSRMARLIGQVLDASRLQHGSLQMNKVPVDVSKLLADVVDESRTAYPGVATQLESPDSLPMHADPDRIAQLFSNLISNARHHGTPGAPVIVRLSSENGGAQLEVRNEAPAIAEDIVPHLFNAFRRGPVQNARNKGGLGLGLHIAQAIVVGHGGEIAYRHEEPHVVFTVRLPVVPSTVTAF
ncbi:MAG: histidine kinase, partial [Gammaproteobacteria bacterium]|nr:histidine kinase [Gammaproteobacteria bacterium]